MWGLSADTVYRQRPVNFWDLLGNNEYVGQFHPSHHVENSDHLIKAFLFNPNPEINLAAITYRDGRTIVFDPEVQKAQAEAETDTSILAASPDGTVLATGSGGGIIKLYDFETMKLLWQMLLVWQNIKAIAFNSTGTRFFDIRGDFCNVWEPSVLVRHNQSGDNSSVDCSAKEPTVPGIGSISTYDNDLGIAAVSGHHGSHYIFCGRENGSVASYATKSGLIAQELFQHDRNIAIDFLVWNQHENLLASASRAGQVSVRRLLESSQGLISIGYPILDDRL